MMEARRFNLGGHPSLVTDDPTGTPTPCRDGFGSRAAGCRDPVARTRAES